MYNGCVACVFEVTFMKAKIKVFVSTETLDDLLCYFGEAGVREMLREYEVVVVDEV